MMHWVHLVMFKTTNSLMPSCITHFCFFLLIPYVRCYSFLFEFFSCVCLKASKAIYTPCRLKICTLPLYSLIIKHLFFLVSRRIMCGSQQFL